jgi:hypothetical protein
MSATVALELPNMTINGYTATLTLSGESGAELIRILKDMQAAGMTQSVAPVPAAAPSGTAPICPVHNRPMKPSRKPGSWYCSAKVGEGYCDQRVKG